VARIVAGVDQSPGARRALAWAAQEAGLREAVLQVVHSYHGRELAVPFYFPSQHALPATTVGRAGEPAPEELAASMGDHAEFEQAYRGQAEEFLQGLDDLQEPLRGVQVQPTVVADQHPAEALVDLSADAELLMLGSRGHGGFGELLLGSVSHAVVLHAVCPVVVVPSPRDKRRIRPPLPPRRAEAT
jgi:nucleotide-binding universal stress UspA family protein